MMPNTKPSAGATLLAFGVAKPKKAAEAADDGEEDLGLSSAANAVFDALKANDKSAFAAALHTYVKQCVSVEDNYSED